MRRYIPHALFALLVGGLAFANAQNINRSVQLSQDPSGPIGFDTTNNVYFPAHVLGSGTAPVVSTCGTTPANVGSDFSGLITEGSGAVTTCSMTFRRAYAATPYCVASSTGSATPLGVNATPNGVIFSHIASAVSMGISYICSGKT